MNVLWWVLFGVSVACGSAAILFLVKWLKVKISLAEAVARIRELEAISEERKSLSQEAVEAAKIALAETGQLLSSKLIDDHKRENTSAAEQFQKLTKEITTPLSENIAKISGIIANISTTQQTHEGTISTLIQALKTPSGSGKIAEIGLENLLKSFGLEKGRDFETQFSIGTAGSRLRPDALIYLPQNRIMVVDCKASSFLIDDSADEALASSMNQHLRDLENRDYRAAIIADFRKNKNTDPTEVLSVMYVPTESLVERVKKTDQNFAAKLMRADIILASPATLHGLLSLARLQIENEKQLQNSEKIIEVAGGLLDGIVGAFAHVEKLGRSLKSSVDAFNSFTGSANQFVLARANKITSLGVNPSRGKQLPKKLQQFEITNLSESSLDSETAVELSIVKN